MKENKKIIINNIFLIIKDRKLFNNNQDEWVLLESITSVKLIHNRKIFIGLLSLATSILLLNTNAITLHMENIKLLLSVILIFIGIMFIMGTFKIIISTTGGNKKIYSSVFVKKNTLLETRDWIISEIIKLNSDSK